MTQTYKKKLIEVAIPLEAINAASVREKFGFAEQIQNLENCYAEAILGSDEPDGGG